MFALNRAGLVVKPNERLSIKLEGFFDFNTFGYLTGLPFMEIKTHQINNTAIAEVVSQGIVINNIEDGIDLLGNVYYQGFDKMILYEKNLTPEFFDLKTKMAGEILQKFSNYRMRLIIVGDFTRYESKSLKDFIFESNNGRMVNFVGSLEEAIDKFKI